MHLSTSLDNFCTLGEVPFEVLLALVSLTAPLADKFTFFCMHRCVLLELRTGVKCLPTLLAHEASRSCVDVHVLCQVEFLAESLTAEFTGILFVCGMVPEDVAPESWSTCKTLVAELTDVSFNAEMAQGNVVLQIVFGVHPFAAELAMKFVAAGAGVQLGNVTLQVALVAQDFVAVDAADAYAPFLHSPVAHDLQLVFFVVKHYTGLVWTPLTAPLTQMSLPIFLLSATGMLLVVGLK